MLRNFRDFELPNDGEIPSCQIDGRESSKSYELNNLSACTNALHNYPTINITRDLLHSTSSGDEGRDLFLPVNVSYLKQLSQIYYEQGAIEVLQKLADHDHFLVSKTAKLVLSILKYVRRARLILNPNLSYSGPNLINNYCQSRDWLNTTIRCISWHPYCIKVAVVTCDDSVRIFNGDVNAASTLLRCKQQKYITCAAWRPMSNTEIAVGHENGIIVWNVDPNSLVSRPSINNATILERPGHRPVMSIAWSRKGDKLVSVAACDTSIYVWDVELDKTSALKRSGGSGNLLVTWSPTGEKLFTCSNSVVFRVWDCRNWECERWRILTGRVQSACWSKCGTVLLFATNAQPIIYGVIVKKDLIFCSDSDSSSNQALPLFDTSEVNIDGNLLGGLVQCMESDPTGNHLAVTFQDSDCVALFDIARQQGVQLIASSLITGLPEEKPSTMSFLLGFERGVCLSVGWSSGRIQYYPVIYFDLPTASPEINRINSKFNSQAPAF